MLHTSRATYGPASRTAFSCKSQRKNTLPRIPCSRLTSISPRKAPLSSAESAPWTRHHSGWDPECQQKYLHGPGLAPSGLAIGKNGTIKAADDWLDDWPSDLLVNVDLVSVRAENPVEGEVVFVVLSAHLATLGITLMASSLLVWVTHSTPLLAISILLRGRSLQTTFMESLIQNIYYFPITADI